MVSTDRVPERTERSSEYGKATSSWFLARAEHFETTISTMSIAPETITKYLSRYAATLTEFDAEAAASLWSVPGMVTNDRFSGVVTSHEEMIDGLKQSYPLYQKLGLAAVDFELLDLQSMTELLVLVKVRWLFLDGDSSLLTDSSSYYLLRQEESGLQACLCIETDSAEKLKELAARLGIDLFSTEP